MPRANKVFVAYDTDSSGAIDATEFLCIMQVLDPTLEKAEINKTFQMVGAGEHVLSTGWYLLIYGGRR